MVIGWLISLFLVFASLPRWVHATTWQKNFPNLHDINEWHYPDLEEQANTDFEPKRRVWDRAMLKSATSNANYAALKPLIERLERGERVVVAALGSSQVADFAGCWGNISLVKETVEVLHSTYGAHKCGAPVSKFDSDGSRTHKLPGFMPGWGHGLMLFINKTWPNPRHVFVNIGSGGYTFYSYADQGCLDSHIPRRLDLLILEQNERGGANAVQLKQAESFMWRLARHFTGSSISPVPIVMVSTIAVAQPYSPHSECMAHGKCTGCSVEYQHSIKPSLVGQCMEDQYLPLLKHFGFSSFSLRNFYLHVLSSGALAKNGNLTACQFLGKLHIDVMHLDALGQILISDILVNYFVESIDYLKVENKDSLGTWRLPETTFSPSVTISVSRCYGKQLTYEHLLHGGESKSEETAKFAAISSGSDSGSIDLKVKSNQGWKWIEFHTHGEHKKFKPGWVAEAPGSEIQIEVDSSFPGSPYSYLVLLYLTSYEHHGVARLSCVSGCTCSEVDVDAHRDVEKISVIQLLKHNVSSSPSCVFSLKTLPKSSSTGHRWKLVQVAVSTIMDALPLPTGG